MTNTEAKTDENVNVRLTITTDENDRIDAVKRSIDFKSNSTSKKMELQKQMMIRGLEAYEAELNIEPALS